jgi:hypothetical protein
MSGRYQGLYCWRCDKPTGNTDECVGCAMARMAAERREANASVLAEERQCWDEPDGRE